jgi:light-regulated signal transduction histidine kinase (bacteriophytochrome)
MVKMIAEVHGGNVKVQSTLGVGSTFIVSFPDTCQRTVEGEKESGKNKHRFHRFKRNR